MRHLPWTIPGSVATALAQGASDVHPSAADGAAFSEPVLMAAAALGFIAGCIVGIVSLWRGRRQAMIHRTIVEAMEDSVVVAVTDRKGRIAYANHAFEKLSGYDRGELVGSDHRLLNSGTHPKQLWREMYRTVLAGGTWRGEVCNRSKNGSLYWVDSVVRAVLDKRRRPEHFVAVRVDVTQRREAEDAARRQRSRFDAMVHGSRVGLWEVPLDEGGAASWGAASCSARFAELVGAGPGASDRWPAWLAGEVRARVVDAADRAMREGQPVSVEFQVEFQAPGGPRVRWLHLHGQRVTTADGVLPSLAGGLEDITPFKEAMDSMRAANEHLQASSKAKSDFLANASHELRTPLTSIMGYLDLVRDESSSLTTHAAESLGAVQRHADHLLALIQGLLDLSAAEEGLLRLSPAPLDFAGLVQQSLDAALPRLEGKGLTLDVRGMAAGSVSVLADGARLGSAVGALLDNAIKFTERGGIRVTLASRRGASGLATAELRVRDTGCGMTPEEQSRLFLPFEQADAGSARRASGLGLGLHLARHIARLSGGDITVSSAAGEGTEVRLTLPCVEEHPAAAGVNAGVGAPHAPLSGMRLLLAEDSPDNQRLIAAVLRRAGAEVCAVDDGRQALAVLGVGGKPEPGRADGFDAIVMDMQMPVVDGYSATRALRSHGVLVPVLALTAHALASDRAKCLSAGCTEYQTKPINRERLIRTIRHLVLDSRARLAAG